jgi:prepilin-type N-terminal cleavage/methylation domain-containing protein
MDRTNQKDAGFTLLEALAVLAIATLVLGIALPRIGSNASPASTEAIALRAIAALDEDRYAARRRGLTLSSEIDIQNNTLKLATRRDPFVLPPTVKLGTRAAPACDPSGRHVIFYADGTSCAPIITMTSATATRVVVVNALSGAIALGE